MQTDSKALLAGKLPGDRQKILLNAIGRYCQKNSGDPLFQEIRP